MRLPLLLVIVVAACRFDPSGTGEVDGDVAGIDAPAPADAPPPDGSEPCVPGCADDVLTTCGGSGPSTEVCALGCVEEPSPRCLAVAPSNGVSRDELDGVTAGLSARAGHVLVVFSHSGAVQDYNVGNEQLVVVRAAGPGVSEGIGYSMVGNLGVLSLDTLTVDAAGGVLVVGTAPLVVLVRGEVTVEGWIDASAGCFFQDAYRVWCAGPGGGRGGLSSVAPATGCGPGGNGVYVAGIEPESGAGGGAAGQAGAASGSTATGDRGEGGSAAACAGARLEPLLGGSGGGATQRDDAGTQWSSGGGGGGALQITSLTSIEVSGEIVAVGEGGELGPDNNGGGGGGGGGSILLEAPSVRLDGGAVWTGGGAGGAGRPPTSSGTTPPDDGSGEAGRLALAVARGGVGSGPTGNNGRGGNGGRAGTTPTSGGGLVDGTGGGGGGAGRLRVNALPDGISQAGFVRTALMSTGALGLE
jgi:hypothetical protein